MMLFRRSVTAFLSPFQQVAAMRSFTATVAIKVDEKEDNKVRKNVCSFQEPVPRLGRDFEFDEIYKQLRALDTCLTDLRDRMDDKIMDDEKSDDNVQNINHFRNLDAMIQDEGMKTRSAIQDEEKKNRLLDAISKLGNRTTTYYFKDFNADYTVPQCEGCTVEDLPGLLRSILRAFLAGEGFHVKADDVGRIELGLGYSYQLRKTLSVTIVDLTGTAPQYKVNAKNGFTIYHG